MHPHSPASAHAAHAAALAAFEKASDQEWFTSTFETILQVSLRENSSVLFMKDLVDELVQESIPLQLGPELSERALYSRLQLDINKDPMQPALFDFLAGVWTRAATVKNSLRQFAASANEAVVAKASARLQDIAAVQALALNYAGLVLNPDMHDSFPQNHSWGAGFLGYKLLDCFDPETLYPRDFMNDFVARFDNDGLYEIVECTVKSVVTAMRTKKVLEDYQSPIKVLTYLASFKQIAHNITLLPDWDPDYCNPRTIEVLPILGPFLSRTGTFPDSDPEIPAKLFASADPFGQDAFDQQGYPIGARNYGDVESAKTSLRERSQTVHASLYNLFMLFIKASPQSKEKLLQLIAHIIKSNIGRGKMHVDRRNVSTDGFMYNLMHVCIKLCEPIMDANYSKLALIDPDYLTYTTRIETTDVTRILADKEVLEKFRAEWTENHAQQPPVANFVSEIFYLTGALHHFGLLSTMRFYADFLKELDEMRKQATKYKAIRDSGAWNSLQAYVRASNEEGLKRLQNEIDKLVAFKLTMDAALKDRTCLERSLQYYNLVMMFLIRVAHGNPSSTKQASWNRVARGDTSGLNLFPLPATPAVEFAVLPEWMIEDVCEFYLFVMRNVPTILEHHPRDEIITFSMVFLSNPTYIKNPYLKSKLVEILFYFTIPLYRTQSGETRGRLDGVFASHPLAKQYLVRSILGFYVDVEQTGMHSQFYDKFNIRYNISQILKSVWDDPVHRAMVVQSSRDKEFFVKFVALLMNDTTYLLDEGLSKLKEIGVLQVELAQPLPDNASTEEKQRRQEREKVMAQSERQALSYVSLSNETVRMLEYLTGDADIVEPFMASEIVERLAAMLDFNLVVMVGPRSTELKISHPEKYRFDPRRLLSGIVGVFLNLAHRKEFVHAIAKDGRSYNKSIFDRVAAILSRTHMKNEVEILRLKELVDSVEATLRSEQLEEEEMGDAPDEFLDPLLFHLMEDPVILPASGVSIDRSTIKAHLLSDAHDPFNRQPLSIEQVLTNDDLRKRIEDWKQEKRQQRRNNDMDTSA